MSMISVQKLMSVFRDYLNSGAHLSLTLNNTNLCKIFSSCACSFLSHGLFLFCYSLPISPPDVLHGPWSTNLRKMHYFFVLARDCDSLITALAAKSHSILKPIKLVDDRLSKTNGLITDEIRFVHQE